MKALALLVAASATTTTLAIVLSPPRLRIGERLAAGNYGVVHAAILDDQNAGRAHNPDGNFLPFLRQFPDGR